MIESRQSQVTLNVPAAGIELLLEYIYTSKLHLNLENIQDVLAAANYIQLESVISHCRNYLQSQLDLENCIDILTISETYSLHRLKEKVYRFICSHLYELSKMSEFCRLTSCQLMKILSSDYYPVDCTELSVLKIAIMWISKSLPSDALSEQHQILQHIRYKYIPLPDLEITLAHLQIYPDTNIYEFVVHSAQLAHRSCACSSSGTTSGSSEISILSQNNLLINYRGMELAVIKIGGFDLSGITNEITYCFPDVFDAKLKRQSKIWKHLTSIPHIKQSNFGTVVLHNQLFVIGGCYDISLQEYIHPFGFKYCPILNKWQTIAPMQQDRCRFSLNVVGGSLYAVGGVSEMDEEVPNVNYSTCEKYNAMTDKWDYFSPIPEYRTQHAGASLGLGLYICGGLDAYGQVLETFWRYNTQYNCWAKMPDLLGPRTDHVLLTIGHKLYVCGGWYEINTSRVLANTIEGELFECVA
jgi:kelch-like protein 26